MLSACTGVIGGPPGNNEGIGGDTAGHTHGAIKNPGGPPNTVGGADPGGDIAGGADAGGAIAAGGNALRGPTRCFVP